MPPGWGSRLRFEILFQAPMIEFISSQLLSSWQLVSSKPARERGIFYFLVADPWILLKRALLTRWGLPKLICLLINLIHWFENLVTSKKKALHLCHILLIKTKLQVLPALKGKEIYRAMDTRGQVINDHLSTVYHIRYFFFPLIQLT